MKFQIKKIKYYLNQSDIYLYLKFFFKTFFINKNFKLFSKQITIKSLGGFKTRINIFNIDELISLYLDIDYILGFRYFMGNKTAVYIYSSKSNLLYNFFSITLNRPTYVCSENFIKNYKKNKNLIILDKKNFFKKISKIKHNNNHIFIDDNIHRFKMDEVILNFRYIFLKCKNDYLNAKSKLYFYDKFGKINLNDRKYNNKYLLYSKISLLPKTRTKELISGVACLKNLDIYPFDICFESALKVLDELIIGIDKESFNTRYKTLLDKFLKQTKYKDKIKVKFFNFYSSTTNNCATRGRWVADVFNILSNECRNKNIMLCGADELFDFNLKEKLNKNILMKHDEIKMQFYHFVYNLNSIRDPRYTSYNSWHRIVKANKYVSNQDGMGFRKNDFSYPVKKSLDCAVYHIGYVINYQKKIKMHMNKKNGVFGNLYSKKKYISLIKPINVDKHIKKKLLNTMQKFKYMNGYKQLIKLF